MFLNGTNEIRSQGCCFCVIYTENGNLFSVLSEKGQKYPTPVYRQNYTMYCQSQHITNIQTQRRAAQSMQGLGQSNAQQKKKTKIVPEFSVS